MTARRQRSRNRRGGASLLLLTALFSAPLSGAVYYVSSQTGDDGNTGLTPLSPLATLGSVGGLALLPGDEVRLFCGERWRTDPLVITRSGSAGSPIVVTSHPLGCANRPVLSGAQPITGWASAGADLWVADLDLGANAGRFPQGLTQLFRGNDRLPFGRWPNPDSGDGYATIDSHPAPAQLLDAGLPAGDWRGAIAHVKGIRWYILNREILSDSGSLLVLGDSLQCIGTASCASWGYFLSSHLLALDSEGEWFYDEAGNQVFLYSQLGAPSDNEIEGSVVVPAASSYSGAIEIGRHLQEEVGYLTVRNLRIERWWDAGITYPVNLEADDNHHLVLEDLEIVDVESTGLRLATWVWNAQANGKGPDGWRGGRDLVVQRVTISGPNHFGIDTYAVDSTFADNVVRDVGLIANLTRSGLGCGTSGTNCTENGDGFRLRKSPGTPDDSGRNVQLLRNRLERIGMNGIDVFGNYVTLQHNVVRDACITKGDCGAVRTFGRTSLAATSVHDVLLDGNIVDTVQGNTDGCHPTFRSELGIGLYLDHYSRDVLATNNTVTRASWVGLLYQDSTGAASGNVLYDNGYTQWGSQIDLRGAGITQASLHGNVMFSLGDQRWTVSLPAASLLSASDDNIFMSPWRATHIRLDTVGGAGLDLPTWRSTTGFDSGSSEQWYSLTPADSPLSVLLVNETASAASLDPGPGVWVDLDQQPVVRPVSVAAYSSRVVVGQPGAIFADGFDSGDTSAWTASVASP